MRGRWRTLQMVIVAGAIAVVGLLLIVGLAGRPGGTESEQFYLEQLLVAKNGDERELIIDRYIPSHSQCRALMRFYEQASSSRESTLMLFRKLVSGKCRDPKFTQFLIDVRTLDSDVEKFGGDRGLVWAYLWAIEANIPEATLVNRLEFENRISPPVFTDEERLKRGDIGEVQKHQIALIARRLYPESTWWRPYIMTKFDPEAKD